VELDDAIDGKGSTATTAPPAPSPTDDDRDIGGEILHAAIGGGGNCTSTPSNSSIDSQLSFQFSKMERAGAADVVIGLNVGGHLFTTTRATLVKDPQCMLARMFAPDSTFALVRDSVLATCSSTATARSFVSC
jgi:hypothetical protein